MGLTNEERIGKALHALLRLADAIDPHRTNYWEHKESLQHFIDPVKESAMQLVGTLIQKIDTNGAYWIIGENEDGFRGLRQEFFHPEDPNNFGQAACDLWWNKESDRFSTKQFAQHCGFDNYINLAAWWDLWSWIPAILYAVNRYEDDVFPEAFRRELNRLIYHMQQFHYHLADNRHQEEQVLLLKYHLYSEDYLEEESWSEHINKLRKMSQKELSDEISRREREKWERGKEDESKEKKIDPIVGDAPSIKATIQQVRDGLRVQKCPYVEDEKILRTLDLYEGNVEAVVEVLTEFLHKEKDHERRYGEAKVCQRCGLVVLDRRNKTGYCVDCLAVKRRMEKNK